MESKPDASCQTVMTFDKHDEAFKLFEEQIHHQTVSSANSFADIKVRAEEIPEDMQEIDAHDPPRHLKEDLNDLTNETFIQWKYEVTGFTYQGPHNYFLWWMRHPEHKAWYANIQARDETHLWIEHGYFWQSAKAMEDTDMQDLVNALRIQFE